MLLDNEITVVSWGSFPEPGKKQEFAEKHIKVMGDFGIPLIFVDTGSKVPTRNATIFTDGISSEAVAKNEGLSHVTTKYVAFTDYDTIISSDTIYKTGLVIRNSEILSKFILQGYPWVMSEYHKSLVMANAIQVEESIDVINKMSVCVAVPRIPSGSWQVCLTEDARAIGGFDETIHGDPSADFHERMRAYVLNDEFGQEVLTKSIPVVKTYFHEYDEAMYGPSITRYLQTANPETLRWDHDFR